MSIQIKKEYHFHAAHRNKGAGEKCGRIHGHTYDLALFIKTDAMDEAGVTILFSDIDEQVETILGGYDHWLLLFEQDPLAEVLEMANEPFKALSFETSAENMAIWLFNKDI